MQNRRVPDASRALIDQAKQNTRHKGIENLRGILMHHCEQKRADQNGIGATERQAVGQNGAAEKKFLAKAGNDADHDELQNDLKR